MPPPIRGSDVFIGEDVLRMIRSIAATHEMTRRMMQDTPTSEAYSAGFIDGLRTMAESMGLHFQPGRGNVSIGVRWDG